MDELLPLGSNGAVVATCGARGTMAAMALQVARLTAGRDLGATRSTTTYKVP